MTSFIFSTSPPKVSIPKIDIQPDGKISIIQAHFYSDQEFDEYIQELTEAFKGEYGADEPDKAFSRIIPFDEFLLQCLSSDKFRDFIGTEYEEAYEKLHNAYRSFDPIIPDVQVSP